MITCHLTKLETAVDQLRKAYPKMSPTDIGLLASALVLSGRHALAQYDGKSFRWPDDYGDLTSAIGVELGQIEESGEPVKKTKAAEEETVTVTVQLSPNFDAGSSRLGKRDDLRKTLSSIIEEGVEFVYSPTDVGWQWALDRANWTTIRGQEPTRKVKVRAVFGDGAVGVEMGAAGKKRARKSS